MPYPLPEIISFMNHTAPSNWTYCERYIELNGTKIKESLPLNKKLSSKTSTYKNGIVIKRVSENIVFITYTILDKVCVFNHESVHNAKGDVLELTVNGFYNGVMQGVDDDGVMYLRELLASMIKSFVEKKFEWDIVK